MSAELLTKYKMLPYLPQHSSCKPAHCHKGRADSVHRRNQRVEVCG